VTAIVNRVSNCFANCDSSIYCGAT